MIASLKLTPAGLGVGYTFFSNAERPDLVAQWSSSAVISSLAVAQIVRNRHSRRVDLDRDDASSIRAVEACA